MQTQLIALLQLLSFSLIVLQLQASPKTLLKLTSADKILGRVVTTISLDNSELIEPAALEWTFRYGKSVLHHVAATPGQQAVLADKQITCASAPEQTTCATWGFNQKTMKSGVIAHVVLTFADPSTEAKVVSFYPKAAATADGQSLPINQRSISKVPPRVRRALRRIESHTKLLASIIIFAILIGALGLISRRAFPKPG